MNTVMLMIDPNDYTPEVFAQLKKEFPEEFDPENHVVAPIPDPPPPQDPPTFAEIEAAVKWSCPTPAHVASIGPNLKDEHYAALQRLIASGELEGTVPWRTPPRTPINVYNRPKDTGPDEATPHTEDNANEPLPETNPTTE